MTLSISLKHRKVIAPATAQVANLFPTAMMLSGGHCAVPHGAVETILLRALGYQVPSPLESYYVFGGTKPYETQIKTAAFLSMNKRAYCLNGMGTGKTKALLWAYDYLRSEGATGRVLAVVPLSTMVNTWQSECFQTVPHINAAVLHGSKERRLKYLNSDAEILIINHDGITVIFDELMAALKSGDITHVIIDELAAFRHKSSSATGRTSCMMKLAAAAEWVWGVTGTPVPNKATDAWAQCRIVTPNTVPRYFSHFQNATMVKDGPFKWKPRPEALEIVHKAMQPAIRFSLDEVVELPDCVEQHRTVTLGVNQKRHYNEMRKTAMAKIGTHEITAMNAGVEFSKLLQISMGWVYDGDGAIVQLDNEDRVDALLNVIEAAPKKVIVYVPFKHALEGLSEALTKAGVDHAVVSGDTPPNKRPEIFRLFQQTNKYKVILAHPRCMAHGITLTAATVTVWFSPITSGDIFEQASHRFRRIGQKERQLLLMFAGTPAETRLYKLLLGRRSQQLDLLDLFSQEAA